MDARELYIRDVYKKANHNHFYLLHVFFNNAEKN